MQAVSAFHDIRAPTATALLSAVLQTLSEKGPNPTALRASPASDFVADGRLLRSASGWWVTFGCMLEISSQSTEGDDPDELVSLHFSGSRDVHNGVPFLWELVYGIRENGERRLMLRDHASYPDPWRYALQYHAIGRCREALLERTAARLGHDLGQRNSVGAVIAAVVASVFGSHAGQERPAGLKAQPMWRPPDESANDFAFEAPPPEPPSPSPFAWAVKTTALGHELGSQEVAAYHVLDETPRMEQPPARTAEFALGAAASAPTVAAPVPSSLAAAEAFAGVFSAAQSARDDGPARGSEPILPMGGVGLQPRHHTSVEDEVDSLRARMPDRSTDTLREMVRQRKQPY